MLNYLYYISVNSKLKNKLKEPGIIFIPTYNESENIEKLYNEICSLNHGCDLLFLDDNSPDGSGKIIDSLVEDNKNVYVIHRKQKSGIGSAHQDALRWAYERKYKTFISMDCDFTHSPALIPKFIQFSENYDVVLGSRFIEKDSLMGWNGYRKFLTYLGHFFTKFLLGIPYDATGAFRLYDLEKIPIALFKKVNSKSYSFFFESLFILQKNAFRIKEFPIALPARTYGTSKMKRSDVIKSFLLMCHLFLKSIFNHKYYIVK
ncbi:MAG: glycosyltransferase [Sphingobacteriaceae bacterium]|nr:glycosyltransferase [Sphingobacteriaceae bacterium]